MSNSLASMRPEPVREWSDINLLHNLLQNESQVRYPYSTDDG